MRMGGLKFALYGLSEMFVDTFLELIKAGVVKREVDGSLLHAAFFLGPKAFYRALRGHKRDAVVAAADDGNIFS